MTPKELYARFRSDVVDAVEPFLWTKDEVWGYMDDAQKKLCRLTDGIRDASSEAAEADIVTGEAFVDLHPAVMFVRTAALGSTGRDLRIFSYEEFLRGECPWSTAHLNLSGPVRGAIIGMEEQKLRLDRIPQVDDTLALVVERLPLVPLISSDIPDEFEVREEHHLALLMWMKHLAFSKQDTETYNNVMAEKMELAFRAYCAEALIEKKRRNHKPRLLAYGGI